MTDIFVRGPNAKSAHGHAVPGPFTPAEQAELRADDLLATRIVAGLMTVIFAGGLVLYTVVLITTL